MSDVDVFDRTENKIILERNKTVENYNSSYAAMQAVENYGQGLVSRFNQIFQSVSEITSPTDQLSVLADQVQKLRDAIVADVENQRNQRIYLQAKAQCLDECVGMVREVQDEMEREQKQREELLNKEAVQRVSERIETGDYDPEGARSTGTRPERMQHVRQAQTLGTLGGVRGPE